MAFVRCPTGFPGDALSRWLTGMRPEIGPAIFHRNQDVSTMAMTMDGEYELPATRETVWRLLNDPAVLQTCIPGCTELNVLGPDEFEAIAVNKIGPVKATFRGRVALSDIDPPNGYRITGNGDGGVVGFAKGGAVVTLTETPGGTLLRYEVEAQIGGKLAQLGQRLINGAAKKMADQFFERFAEQVGNEVA